MSNSSPAAIAASAPSNSTGAGGETLGAKSWAGGSRGTGSKAGAGAAAAMGSGIWDRAGAEAASGIVAPMACVIFSSSGLRGPGCSETAINRAKTSNAAANEAAEVCARSIGGRAFVGLLLEQAATTSLMACCSSSPVRWMRSRLSRPARAMAISTALGSGDIRVSGPFRPKFSRFAILGGCGRVVNGAGAALCLKG